MKIIIADDHRLYADGIEQILIDDPRFHVIGKAHDGAMLLKLIDFTMPELVILDLNMPNINGLDAAIQIKAKWPEIKLFVVSMDVSKSIANKLHRIRAEGYCSKNVGMNEFIMKMEQVAQGKIVYPDELRSEVNYNEASIFNLTKREMEIIRLIKDGVETKAIADQLYLSTFTVDTHRKNIFKKLNVHSIPELISFSFREGI